MTDMNIITKSPKKLIYVAGRYRGRTRAEVESNIQAAIFVGRLCAEKGWYPVIPHSNTAHFEALVDVNDEFYLEGTLELMRRCDAVVMVPGFGQSVGAMAEHDEAHKLFMTVYRFPEHVPDMVVREVANV